IRDDLVTGVQTCALPIYGFRVIIAPSYADIFYNNCFKNGILPATLPEDQVEELFKRTEKEEGYSLTVNLPNQTIGDKHGLILQRSEERRVGKECRDRK